MDLYLDQAVLRARNARRCDEIILLRKKGKDKKQVKRQKERGGAQSWDGTSMTPKDAWAQK